MKRETDMKDIGWKRSPRGKIFGVVTGLAEWRELDPQTTRTIVMIISFCTMPLSIIIYLILALILPMDHGTTYTDYEDRNRAYRKKSAEGVWENATDDFKATMNKMKDSYDAYASTKKDDVEDAKWEERSTDDIRKEYEDLKKKVESMEAEMFDKEKDWDARFKDSEDR